MLEVCTDAADAPAAELFERWCACTLAAQGATGDVAIALVDADHSRSLNRDYRGRDRATNVLAFPAGDAPHPGVAAELPLGDLVLCPEVVRAEARDQGKTLEAHYAHLVVHGVLHLLGFDHQDEVESAEMEARERTLLAGLGFPDPYTELPSDGVQRNCA